MAVQPEQFAGYEELCRKIEAGTASRAVYCSHRRTLRRGKEHTAQQLARDLGGRVVSAGMISFCALN